MSEKETGGPAFPTSTLPTGYAEGMSLRDYLAAKAMAVLLRQCNEFPDEHWRIGVAKDAYKMADAMIEEKNK